MFVVAKMTHRATETLCQHRSLSESAMAWRMSLLVATDAACWVPIIGLGLVSLAGFKVPSQVRVPVTVVREFRYVQLERLLGGARISEVVKRAKTDF